MLCFRIKYPRKLYKKAKKKPTRKLKLAIWKLLFMKRLRIKYNRVRFI